MRMACKAGERWVGIPLKNLLLSYLIDVCLPRVHKLEMEVCLLSSIPNSMLCIASTAAQGDDDKRPHTLSNGLLHPL